MTSRLERTTAILRQHGIKYWKTEVWNAFARRGDGKRGMKVDLFNIIDILALDGGIVGIQVCGNDYMDHVRKVREDEAENTRAWLEAGGRLEIHAWRKVKVKRGGKAMQWKPRVADVMLVNGDIYIEERTG
jgi:hypothetical protein